MAQQPSRNTPNYSESLVQELVKTEQQKLQYKLEELKIKSKEIDANEKLAKISMDYQYKLLEKKPKQHKETTVVYTVCGSIFLLIFLGFLAYLVVNDKGDFAATFLHYIAYIIVAVLSYKAGQINQKNAKNTLPKNKSDHIQDATVVD